MIGSVRSSRHGVDRPPTPLPAPAGAGLTPDAADGALVRDDTWMQRFEDLDDEPPARRRRPALPFLVALPWLVLVAVLVLPRLAASEPPSTSPHDAAPTIPVDAQGDEALELRSDEPASTAPAETAREVGPARSATIPGDDLRHGALAIALARAWLSGMGPPLHVGGIQPPEARYAEHLTVEAIERTSDDTAVVTVLATVFEGPDELEIGLQRVAVPLLIDGDGAHPAGAPWQLASPRPVSRPPEATRTLTDPEDLLAAADALRAEGYLEAEVLQLSETDRWPVLVHFALPDEVGARTAWLQRTDETYVVVGARGTENDR